MVKRNVLLILINIFLFIVFVKLGISSNKTFMGKIIEVKGKVILRRDTTVIRIKNNDSIFNRDVIKSDTASFAKIKFKDGGILELKENTNVIMDEVSFSKQTKESQINENYEQIIEKVKKMKINRNKLDYTIVPTLGTRGKDTAKKAIDTKKVTIIYKWEE